MTKRECDDEQQVFVVNLLIISESVNGNVLENGPLKIECTHVMIKKLKDDQHRIVVLNKASEVHSCGIDSIADLPYKEDERLVKWRVRDSNGVISTWSLRFEDKHNADNFVRIVQQESSLKVIPIISNNNEAMSSEKVDADHMSDIALPISDRDDDIPLASTDTDIHEGLQVTDDHLSKDNNQLTELVIAGMKQNVVQNGQHTKKENIPENLPSMGDSSAEDIEPTPQLVHRTQAEIDHPAVDTELMMKSSTCTNSKAPSKDTVESQVLPFDNDTLTLRENILHNNLSSDSKGMLPDYVTDEAVDAKQEAGNNQQNHQQETESYPTSAPADIIVFKRKDDPVQHQPSDEVADTEKLACPQTSGANYADNVTSTGEVISEESESDITENEQPKDVITKQKPKNDIKYLDDKLKKKYLEKMVDSYLNSAARSYLREKEKNQTKGHRCIAALICHPCNEEPFVAVLCTGTKYNDGKCYSTQNNGGKSKDSPCDSHAESLCIEAAPIYLQNEMLSCLDGEISIFEYKNNHFTLKPKTEFHLLVTEPPCGWIQGKQSPCMEWKQSFSEVPHIPTCSARILINSKMGIQGYISHLLDERIFIKSVIILCVKEDNYDFPPTPFDLELPIITTLEYDPQRFNPKICTFEPMNLGDKSSPSAKSRSVTQNGTKDKTDGHSSSAIAIDQHARRKSFVMNSTYNVHRQSEKDHNELKKQNFSILKRKIDDRLLTKDEKIQQIQKARKIKMKIMYGNLTEELNLKNVLQKRLTECMEYKANKEDYIKRQMLPCEYKVEHEAKHETDPLNVTDMIRQETQKLLNATYQCSKDWIAKTEEFKKLMGDIGTEGKKLIDVQNLINDIEKLLDNPSDCILDCNLKRYFDA